MTKEAESHSRRLKKEQERTEKAFNAGIVHNLVDAMLEYMSTQPDQKMMINNESWISLSHRVPNIEASYISTNGLFFHKTKDGFEIVEMDYNFRHVEEKYPPAAFIESLQREDDDVYENALLMWHFSNPNTSPYHSIADFSAYKCVFVLKSGLASLSHTVTESGQLALNHSNSAELTSVKSVENKRDERDVLNLENRLLKLVLSLIALHTSDVSPSLEFTVFIEQLKPIIKKLFANYFVDIQKIANVFSSLQFPQTKLTPFLDFDEDEEYVRGKIKAERLEVFSFGSKVTVVETVATTSVNMKHLPDFIDFILPHGMSEDHSEANPFSLKVPRDGNLGFFKVKEELLKRLEVALSLVRAKVEDAFFSLLLDMRDHYTTQFINHDFSSISQHLMKIFDDGNVDIVERENELIYVTEQRVTEAKKMYLQMSFIIDFLFSYFGPLDHLQSEASLGRSFAFIKKILQDKSNI